jgi:DNA-binding Xre family transcriptional regulator
MALTRIHRMHLLMIQKGITVAKLAQMTGLTTTTISYIRNGRNTHMSTLMRCANALKCAPADIMGYTMFDFDEYDRQMDAKAQRK